MPPTAATAPRVEHFSGFPEEAIQFLLELQAEQSRAWFKAHQDDYVRLCRRPMELLIEEPYFSTDGGKFLEREAGVRPVTEAASCDAATAGSYLQHFDGLMAALAGGK